MPCTKTKNQVMVTNNKIIISFIGIDDSGKTTVVKALKGDAKNLKDVSPTIGYEPHEIKFQNRLISLYDLGGGVRVRDIWKHYLAESYGFVFVLDSSNRQRLNENKLTFHSFLENPKVSGKPLLVLANKQDHPSAFDESDIVYSMNIEELVNRFEVPCRVETCVASRGAGSKMDESIKLGFDWLVKMIIKQKETMQARIDEDVQKQKTEESRVRHEKSARLNSNKNPSNYNDADDDDDADRHRNPWKSLNELNAKTSKSQSNSSSLPKLTAYERQLIDEMDAPKSRLTTINEENKLKNKPFKNNKLSPYDDRSDSELNKGKSSSQPSWAITDYSSGSKRPVMGKLEPLERPRAKYDY